ncbi:MAG TPA: hypothetical protein VM598_08810 [Bdellovibrionota bacterium]|nr:hypothetical protein [Bdellovibrionota bacterium]
MHLLSILGLMLAAGAAQAGTPEQDPAVAKLRSEFAQASVPTPAQLRYGQNWDCRFHSARKDEFKVNTGPQALGFQPYGGLVFNYGYSLSAVYAFRATELAARPSRSLRYFFIRALSDGHLVVELAEAKTGQHVGSIVDSVLGAATYGVCQSR